MCSSFQPYRPPPFPTVNMTLRTRAVLERLDGSGECGEINPPSFNTSVVMLFSPLKLMRLSLSAWKWCVGETDSNGDFKTKKGEAEARRKGECLKIRLLAKAGFVLART